MTGFGVTRLYSGSCWRLADQRIEKHLKGCATGIRMLLRYVLNVAENYVIIKNKVPIWVQLLNFEFSVITSRIIMTDHCLNYWSMVSLQSIHANP